MSGQPHFLVVTFPAQGHINPSLQFAKRLLRAGARVTFATCVSAHRKIAKTLPRLDGLSFATFSDGYDNGYRPGVDSPDQFMSDMRRVGSETLAGVLAAGDFTCLVYTLLLPWTAEVAREFHVPSVLLWIQPATVLNIYYHYFNGYEEAIKRTSTNKGPECSVKLPGLPLSFASGDLPSFLIDSSRNDDDAYSFILPSFREQMQALDAETNPKILVNTFDSLEPEALQGIQKFKLIAVGPILPSAYLDGKDSSDASFGGDLFDSKEADYKLFLSSKPKASVIYVSFGSISILSGKQTEEMARALLDLGRPFVWVIREKAKDGGNPDELEESEISCKEELSKLGMIVPWCDQLEVLFHPAVGCFVTHCGWNSTLESIVAGVPLVVFPQWTDQGTNAKLVVDAWRKGVRAAQDGEGVVERWEMRRCLEAVMGEEGEEMRNNAKKWKELAREAASDGGSSDVNLRAFVDEVGALMNNGC